MTTFLFFFYSFAMRISVKKTIRHFVPDMSFCPQFVKYSVYITWPRSTKVLQKLKYLITELWLHINWFKQFSRQCCFKNWVWSSIIKSVKFFCMWIIHLNETKFDNSQIQLDCNINRLPRKLLRWDTNYLQIWPCNNK